MLLVTIYHSQNSKNALIISVTLPSSNDLKTNLLVWINSTIMLPLVLCCLLAVYLQPHMREVILHSFTIFTQPDNPSMLLQIA